MNIAVIKNSIKCERFGGLVVHASLARYRADDTFLGQYRQEVARPDTTGVAEVLKATPQDSLQNHTVLTQLTARLYGVVGWENVTVRMKLYINAKVF